jgi:hypothetical protein
VSILSGGEKSRVALAKIIYQNPTILRLMNRRTIWILGRAKRWKTALADYPGTILFVTTIGISLKSLPPISLYMRTDRRTFLTG